jgi:predicted nucleic acid-binding protein
VKILVDINVFIDMMTKRANWEGSLRTLNEEWLAVGTVAKLEADL